METGIYYSKRDGRWLTIFIPDGSVNQYNEICGKIFNLRRRLSHKKIRLCSLNLYLHSANLYHDYSMYPSALNDFDGPYKIYW